MRQSAEGAAMFERDKWSTELSPILNLWKKLNTGSSSLVQVKVSPPKGSGGRKESQGGYGFLGYGFLAVFPATKVSRFSETESDKLLELGKKIIEFRYE